MGSERTRDDVLDYIMKLEKRVSDLETARRITNTTLDTGTLTVVNGDITIVNAEGRVLLRLKGNALEFYPGGSSDTTVKQRTWLASGLGGDDGGVEIAVGNSLSSQNGGRMALSQKSAFYGMQFSGANIPPAVYLNRAGMFVSDDPTYKQAIRFHGLFSPGYAPTGYEAVIADRVYVDPGFSSVYYNYPRSMVGTMAPNVTIQQSGTPVAWTIQSADNSGFTVAWANSTDKYVNVWAVRLP